MIWSCTSLDTLVFIFVLVAIYNITCLIFISRSRTHNMDSSVRSPTRANPFPLLAEQPERPPLNQCLYPRFKGVKGIVTSRVTDRHALLSKSQTCQAADTRLCLYSSVAICQPDILDVPSLLLLRNEDKNTASCSVK